MFCPLHRVFEMQKRHILSNTTIIGEVVGSETPLTEYESIGCSPFSFYATIKCLGIILDEDRLQKYAVTFEDYALRLSKLNGFMHIDGYITAILPRKGVNQGDLLVLHGGLTRIKGTRFSFVLNNWMKQQQDDKWKLRDCDFTPFNAGHEIYTNLRDADKADVNWCLLNKHVMDDRRKIPKYHVDRYMPCGSDYMRQEIEFPKRDIAEQGDKASVNLFTEVPENIGVSEGEGGTTNTSETTFKPADNTVKEQNSFNDYKTTYANRGRNNRLNITDRQEMKPICKEVENLYNEIPNFVRNCSDFKAKLLELSNITDSATDKDEIYNAAKDLVTRLKAGWTRKPASNIGLTGREIFKLAFLNYIADATSISATSAKSGVQDILYALNIKVLDLWLASIKSTGAERDKIKNSLYMSNLDMSDGDIAELISTLEQAGVTLFFYLQGVILSVNMNYAELVSIMAETSVSLYQVLKNNPYVLFLFNQSIALSGLDKFAFLNYGVQGMTNLLLSTRAIAYVNDVMTSSDSNVTDGSTCVDEYKLRSAIKYGFQLAKKELNVYKATGRLMDMGTVINIQTYLKNEFKNTNVLADNFLLASYPRNVLVDTRIPTSKAIEAYVTSGFGLRIRKNGRTYIVALINLKKELEIYMKLYELASDEQVKADSCKITKEKMDECISMFEHKRAEELGIAEFKLEDKQREAVYAVKSPVLAITGTAGSGKTTTAEALVYVLKECLGVTEDKILFTAPTGKAASRLKESVKSNTRTLHSAFCIGVNKNGAKPVYDFDISDTESYSYDEKGKFDVLFIDEAAMPDLDLMHAVIMQLTRGQRVYFLGDIAQLTPIGVGKPFANILQYVACVKLLVSKRASEGSYIIKNSMLINEQSDKAVLQDLESGNDTHIINYIGDPAKNIDKLIADICSAHLGIKTSNSLISENELIDTNGVVNKDDIQIITPVKKKAYNWGSIQLNRLVHDIFCPLDKSKVRFCMKYGNEPVDELDAFRIGDRVLHNTNRSKTNRFHVIDAEAGIFTPIEGDTGVMNGDMGYVIGFYKSKGIRMMASEKGNKVISASHYLELDDSNWYMAVQYKDVDEQGNPYDFAILYCIENVQWQGKNLMISNSSDASMLELAYALTVHKMQGSECKLAICPFYSLGRFISRNMVNTAVTRAKKYLYLIGDIQGRDSAVNKARRIEKVSERLSTLDLLLGE